MSRVHTLVEAATADAYEAFSGGADGSAQKGKGYQHFC